MTQIDIGIWLAHHWYLCGQLYRMSNAALSSFINMLMRPAQKFALPGRNFDAHLSHHMICCGSVKVLPFHIALSAVLSTT